MEKKSMPAGPDRSVGMEPPGPDGLPFLGSAVRLFQDPFQFYEQCAKSYDSDIISYTVAGRDGYILTHPEYIEQVLVSDSENYDKAEIEKNHLDILAYMDREDWAKHREALQPAFYREQIQQYGDRMSPYSDRRMEQWEDGEPVDITEEMHRLTLDVLCQTLLDIDIYDDATNLVTNIKTISEGAAPTSVSSYLPEWVPTPQNLRYRRATNEFTETVDDVVERRKAMDDPPEDLLSLLLSVEIDGEPIDDELARDLLITFLFAGNETSPLSLSYTWFLLAHNPEVQERVYEEVDEVLGGETPTTKNVSELTYVENAYKESLRRYSPPYALFRQPLNPVTIGGYSIPEGAFLCLPQWVVHRDERWWDDPDEYRPERWSAKRESSRHDQAYFPFGAGPTHCISMRFAIMHAKVAIANIAQQYRFEPVTQPPLDFSMGITMHPNHPLELIPYER